MGYTKETIKGFSWMSAMRILTRVLAVVRTAILARILSPDQFGAFAIATISLSFLEIITDTGINLFLIQEESKFKKFINTAFIISILRGVLIFLILAFSAKPISIFFFSPTSVNLLLLLSLVPLIRGFINPAIIKFQIDLNFNKEFLLRSTLFTIDAITAITVSLITRSAIGLVAGFLISAVVEVVASHCIFEEKPKLIFNRHHAGIIIKRGKWITAGGIMRYFADQTDELFVGRMLDNTKLGLYQIAYKISTLPIYEITGVASKVIIPVFTKIRDDKKRLKRAFVRSFLTISLMSLVLGITIFLFAQPVVLIVLGPKWIGAIKVLKILSIFGITASILHIPNALFIAKKRQDLFAKINLIQFMIIAITIYPLVKNYSIEGAGLSTLLSSILVIPLVIFWAVKVLNE